MKNLFQERRFERGGAGVKLVLVALVLVLAAHAGYNYVPVAYEAASFRQEMDTAVVKGLSASGQLKPADVIKAHLQFAARNNNLPGDALIDIKPAGKVLQVHASYSKPVDMLPFGLYRYNYEFDYVAKPTGYLTAE
ncbi:MAG: hypothetical protein ACRD6X_09200 [Pyrinomonadaceae bacterium]